MNKRNLTALLLLMSFLAISLVISRPSTALAATSSLAWGSRGPAVVEVQKTLNNRGYWCGTADGIFGPKTYAAVVRFQQDNGIQAIGVVGPQTRKALGLSSAITPTPVSRGSRILTMVATGYCPCNKCNYPYGGQPSYLGYPLRRGIVAVDPKVIPMGSQLHIEGYGSGLAADQGNAIKGNRIDLFFPTHQEALNWGIRTVRVTVY